jgi:RimJ/RimL family protein N-acetyltransferase
MKRLTKQAQADLRNLIEASQQLKDPMYRAETGSLRDALFRLAEDLGIICENPKALSEFHLLEVIALFKDLFKSQFETLRLIPKAALTRHQFDYLNERIENHPREEGSLRAWRGNQDPSLLYAVCNDNRELIGVLYIFVTPPESPIYADTADVAWWIDDLWKNERLAYAMLDACADECKRKAAKFLGRLRIEDANLKRSQDLERYLRLHFA